jgi:hypothetical protein
MNYFKINNKDYSLIVNELKVNKKANYNAQTNAAGNTIVDFINSKREIEVGIIPLNDVDAAELLNAVEPFNISVSFRNPLTNALEENVNCIIPDTNIEYYTIQQNKVMYKAFTLKFIEL